MSLNRCSPRPQFDQSWSSLHFEAHFAPCWRQPSHSRASLNTGEPASTPTPYTHTHTHIPHLPGASPGPFHPCWGRNNRLGSPACVAHHRSPCSQDESLCNSRRLFIFNENSGALSGESLGSLLLSVSFGWTFSTGKRECTLTTFDCSWFINSKTKKKSFSLEVMNHLGSFRWKSASARCQKLFSDACVLSVLTCLTVCPAFWLTLGAEVHPICLGAKVGSPSWRCPQFIAGSIQNTTTHSHT